MGLWKNIKRTFGDGEKPTDKPEPVIHKRAGFNASQSNRLNPFSIINQNINDMIRGEKRAITSRVRHLVRNFPVFNNVSKRIADYVVGDGFRFQSRVRMQDGSLNQKLNQKIEDEIKWWMDEADISGRMHYYEMHRLLNVTETDTGDYIVIKANPKDRTRRYPHYALQVLDPDWLDSSLYSFLSKSQNTAIDQGIEYDTHTGRVIAYHFTDPDGWGKTMRIPAENVIHGFETKRPGQLRGISPLVAGVLVAADTGDFWGSNMDAAKMQSKFLGFVKKLDQSDIPASGFNNQRDLPFSREEVEDDTRYDEIENAIIEVMRPGEDVTFANQTRAAIDISPFMTYCLLFISIISDTPYEITSGDYTKVNFSTLNTSRRDYRKMLIPKWDRFKRQFCRPSIRPLYDHIALSGRIHMPGYFYNPYKYINDAWQPPGMEPVDVLKVAKANTVDFLSGVNSPQRVTAEQGRDFEEVLAELSEAQKMAEKYGVTLNFSGVSKASQSNAASVEEQSNKPEKKEKPNG